MAYGSSYEDDQKPFLPDTERGHWAVPSDFLYACWALAFKLDIFFILWYSFFELGFYSIIPYLICMALFVVPMILLQSFLGQFSSSGFISVFRIAPLFKGLGYISLAINFLMITHMSAFAVIPLFYLFHSMRPILPWSCESFLEWSKDVPTNGELNICTKQMYGTYATAYGTTTTVSPDTKLFPNATHRYDHSIVHIPSVVYFRSLFSNYDMVNHLSMSLSWQLLLCMFLIWIVIAFIFYIIVTTEQMGKFVRVSMWLLMSLLLICFIRLMFLPHATEALRGYFMPRKVDFERCLRSIPIFALAAFGTGWGNIVSLASYNKFRTNIMRLSWLIALGQMIFLIVFGLLTYVIETHYAEITKNRFKSLVENQWLIYLASGSILADLELPNLWCILFFSLLFLSALLIIVIQLFALLTAIYDEFAFLRPHKQEFSHTLIGLLFVCSIFFCSNYGLCYFTIVPADALFTQTVLNLLLLLVVLWIYGRVRFQRDIEFMLGQYFHTWRVNVLRYIAPLALGAALVLGVIIVRYEHYYIHSLAVYIVAVCLLFIPWIFVPGYGILGIMQTTGPLGMRFKRCCRPTDWYPADPEERQRYEDAMGNLDVTNQLEEVNTEDVVQVS